MNLFIDDYLFSCSAGPSAAPVSFTKVEDLLLVSVMRNATFARTQHLQLHFPRPPPRSHPSLLFFPL
jgi:hypothetical protein